MLTASTKQSARLEINALCRLGFTRSDAISMTAQRLRKSLPTIDTSAADARWKARCKKEEGGEEKPRKDDAKAAAKTVQMRKYITDKVKRVSGVMLTKYRDGSILVKPMNSPPPNYDPGFNTDQQQQMLEMAINHLQKKTKRVPQTGEAKDNTTMDKTDKLDQLIVAAKADPSKLTPETLDRVNRHLVGKGEEPIKKALTFGQSAASQLMRQKFNSLTGHQQAAMSVGCPVDLPGIEHMSIDQMKEVVRQQNIDIANEQRAKMGMPPIEAQPVNVAYASKWD